MTRALFPPTVHAERVPTDAVRADRALAPVAAYLAAVKPSLDPATVRWHDSLTDDLGFDSVDLVSLAATIREDHEEVDLRAWIATAGADGDTVGTLAEFLHDLTADLTAGTTASTAAGEARNGRAA